MSPFSKALSKLPPRRAASRYPLFQRRAHHAPFVATRRNSRSTFSNAGPALSPVATRRAGQVESAVINWLLPVFRGASLLSLARLQIVSRFSSFRTFSEKGIVAFGHFNSWRLIVPEWQVCDHLLPKRGYFRYDNENVHVSCIDKKIYQIFSILVVIYPSLLISN